MSALLRKGEREKQRARARSVFSVFSILSVLSFLAACGEGADGLRVDLDKSNEERLLHYYLSGLAAEGEDPEGTGLLGRDGTAFVLRPEALDPSVRDALRDANDDGTLDWDEFVAFIEATYYDARGLPPTLDAFRADAGFAASDSSWVTLDVDGVVTAARRRIYVREDALRETLEGYREAGEQIIYPAGTVFIAEHWLDGQVVETTVKRRRADSFWDFAVYDASGQRVPATSTAPRALRAPVQCVGCHLGQRRFDPEKSFPAAAPEGPYGPRTIHIAEALRAAPTTAEATALFNEHAKRSDGVLGLYATLYTAQLLADREAGVLAPEDAVLLDQLGL
ncbi:MAG: hypothetical protein HKN04_14330 [Rhodothermaceae bacterium]|nr:hypothetical protein [Rhodothermaceae bacterium]